MEMDSIVWLKPIPRINNMSFADSGKVMYKNPCLMYLGQEVNDFVDSLDNETKATPGKYFIKDTGEVDTVYLYVKKCPPGWEQNVRKSICEPRPGINTKALCTKTDPLTKRSEVDLLKEHIQKLNKGE